MSTITKQLSQEELGNKLKRGGMFERRPDLAHLILTGQCAYEERTVGQAHGENFALRGSPAAYVTTDVQPEPARSAPASQVSDAEVERRLEDIRARHAPRASVAEIRSVKPDAGDDLIRAAEAQMDADEASDDFFRTAKALADGRPTRGSGDASADLLRAVESSADSDYDPFDFGGAA